jgi:hypothetical protein
MIPTCLRNIGESSSFAKCIAAELNKKLGALASLPLLDPRARHFRISLPPVQATRYSVLGFEASETPAAHDIPSPV